MMCDSRKPENGADSEPVIDDHENCDCDSCAERNAEMWERVLS